jgi:hypothetical protein
MRPAIVCAFLLCLGCAVHVEPSPPIPHTAKADTVAVGRHRCVFLTMTDGTHALAPGQHQPCGPAFLRWVGHP